MKRSDPVRCLGSVFWSVTLCPFVRLRACSSPLPCLLTGPPLCIGTVPAVSETGCAWSCLVLKAVFQLLPCSVELFVEMMIFFETVESASI